MLTSTKEMVRNVMEDYRFPFEDTSLVASRQTSSKMRLEFTFTDIALIRQLGHP